MKMPLETQILITEYLRNCAENEGGRAILAIQGYANSDTAAYFAREAAHYARLMLDGEFVNVPVKG